MTSPVLFFNDLGRVCLAFPLQLCHTMQQVMASGAGRWVSRVRTATWATLRAALALCVLSTLGLLSGCESSGTGVAQLELGTGEYNFESVEELGAVELVHGPQGGWHVWLSVRAEHLNPVRVEMDLTTQVMGMPETRDRSIVYLDMVPNELGGHEILGWRAILSQPACAHGREMVIEVAMRDREDQEAFSAIVVSPEALDDHGYLGDCRALGMD